MEKVYLASESEIPEVRLLSEALREAGIDGYDKVHQNEGGHPFFMLPKKYARESEGDPECHHVYIDVCEIPSGAEYKLTMVYTPIYFYTVEDVVSVCKGLLDETVAEVAFVTPIGLASGFIHHTGEHEKNIECLVGIAQMLINTLKRCKENADVLSRGTTQSVLQGKGLIADAIGFMSADDRQYNGITVYAASYLCAYHPEIYVLQ
ncbi:MAG: hypothetical protein J6L90_05420 [Clostridia bacterium]|nr:hypothetical protein [Clostridia bacterium]